MIKATKVFSALIAEWTAKIGTISKPDYNAMLREVEAARLAMDNARATLEFHLKEHDC